MIVISNTSPICYLVSIEAIELLPRLYGEVIIPQAVRDELGSSRSPNVLHQWIENHPIWLKIETVSSSPDRSLDGLDRGEREAIQLAQNKRAGLIILDEQKARRIAENKGLTVIGTLGILYQAAIQDLVNFEEAIERLRATNFRVFNQLIDSLLTRYREEFNRGAIDD